MPFWFYPSVVLFTVGYVWMWRRVVWLVATDEGTKEPNWSQLTAGIVGATMTSWTWPLYLMALVVTRINPRKTLNVLGNPTREYKYEYKARKRQALDKRTAELERELERLD